MSDRRISGLGCGRRIGRDERRLDKRILGRRGLSLNGLRDGDKSISGRRKIFGGRRKRAYNHDRRENPNRSALGRRAAGADRRSSSKYRSNFSGPWCRSNENRIPIILGSGKITSMSYDGLRNVLSATVAYRGENSVVTDVVAMDPACEITIESTPTTRKKS